MDLKDLIQDIEKYIGKEVTINGWIRNHRDQKTFGFIDFSDGTCQEHLQIVYDDKINDFASIQKLLVGCAIKVSGKIIESTGSQKYEMQATNIELIGSCQEDYPIQPKTHTRE